jgi:hypothetical protein
MSAERSQVDEIELFVHEWAAELGRPREKECLCCYLVRQLDDFPCDGTHRHVLRYRDAKVPRATKILERLRRMGAGDCDCDVLRNGYQLRCTSKQITFVVLGFPCAASARGSMQPCRKWVRRL